MPVGNISIVTLKRSEAKAVVPLERGETSVRELFFCIDKIVLGIFNSIAIKCNTIYCSRYIIIILLNVLVFHTFVKN